MNRFGDSSIYVNDLSKVFDEKMRSPNDLCQFDHPALEELKRSQTARYRVFLTRLEPRVTIYRDATLRDPLAVSSDLAENTIAQGEAGLVPSLASLPSAQTPGPGAAGADPKGKGDELLTEALLFDATRVGQVMCLGVGRNAHNLLRPYMGDDPDAYYREPEALDPNALCGQISRDHGLVFLDEESRIFFRDFGTKKEGARNGSKNGTWINGVERVQGVVIPWREGDYLGIGGRAWVQRDGAMVKEHVFKLRYERIA